MKNEKRNQIIFMVCFAIGVILLTGILLAIDFLYAGVQELFLSNINPDYIPDIPLANKVIISSSISLTLGIIIYVLDIWFVVRKKKIIQQLITEETIDEEGVINYRAIQIEISDSLKILRDLFGFIIIVVILTGLFSFLRFIWMIGKYRVYGEFFIHYFLTFKPSLIISTTLYFVIAVMITYILLISLQKFIRLQIISTEYDKGMEKVIINLNRLIRKEQRDNSDDKNS